MPAKHYIAFASVSICYWLRLHKCNNASVHMHTHT